MPTIQITIEKVTQEIGEMLIAQLSEEGFEGFEEREDSLLVFIPLLNWKEDALMAILSPFSLDYSVQELADRNWNEEWERNFQPVRVGDFCAVRASFHEALPGVRHDIVITPKMSFGTGHHATTYMMMEAMERVDFTGKAILDFGTGTGVLAILAEKLGAASITAIDNDDWSIENARENVINNQSVKIYVEKLDQIGQTGLFDVLLANINKNVILHTLPGMSQHLTEHGVIILSGLLPEDGPEIEMAANSCGYAVTLRLERGNWICLQLEKRIE